MLGPRYQFSINNNTGVTFSAVVFMRRWKFASDGSITFDTEQTIINMSATLTSGASSWFHASGPYDNTTDKWLGALIVAELVPSGTANGLVRIVIRRATGTAAITDVDAGEHILATSFAGTSSSRVVSAEIGI